MPERDPAETIYPPAANGPTCDEVRKRLGGMKRARAIDMDYAEALSKAMRGKGGKLPIGAARMVEECAGAGLDFREKRWADVRDRDHAKEMGLVTAYAPKKGGRE